MSVSQVDQDQQLKQEMKQISETQNHYRKKAEWKKLILPGDDIEQQKDSPKKDVTSKLEEISYSKLMTYCRDLHPTTQIKKGKEVETASFGICDNVGGHDFLCCCRTKEVSTMAK